jgi:class 3 adenylate cyclase
MSSTLDEQINQLKQAIAEMEAKRAVLGDATVEAALVPLHKKLAEIETQVEPSVDEQQELPTRQRKLVTLLYMDVVGSTAMTLHLDPEDNLEMMENALLRLAEPIQEHGGRITRYTGDGFKAVFGDPVAREDDPEQAICAGLEILDVSKAAALEIEKEWDIEDFQVRIGIDTGLAALGGFTEGEDTVKGRVVNLAVRIESASLLVDCLSPIIPTAMCAVCSMLNLKNPFRRKDLMSLFLSTSCCGSSRAPSEFRRAASKVWRPTWWDGG